VALENVVDTLWVFLVDISPSMDEGFSGSARHSMEPTEYGDYGSKLDAAKDRIPREVFARPNSDYIIVPFNDEPYLLMQGTTTSADSINECIEEVNQLETGGACTNIAAALRFPLRHVDNLGSYSKLRILLISDGLSNEGDPISASQDCDSAGFTINALVIDKTTEGLDLAHKIANGGAVSTVDTSSRFERGLEAIREASEKSEDSSVAQQVKITQLENELNTVRKTSDALAHSSARLNEQVDELNSLNRKSVNVQLSLDIIKQWGSVIALCLGILTAYSVAITPVITKPGTGISVLSSAVLVVLGCVMVWCFFAKKIGIHLNNSERNLTNRFPSHVRKVCLCCGIICHIAWPSILVASAVRNGGTSVPASEKDIQQLVGRELDRQLSKRADAAEAANAELAKQISSDVASELSRILPTLIQDTVEKEFDVPFVDKLEHELWSRIDARLKELLRDSEPEDMSTDNTQDSLDVDKGIREERR
jgi:hypothetical protein